MSKTFRTYDNDLKEVREKLLPYCINNNLGEIESLSGCSGGYIRKIVFGDLALPASVKLSALYAAMKTVTEKSITSVAPLPEQKSNYSFSDLPRHQQRCREMARAAALLEKYLEHGYNTPHLFCNAVLAVFPKTPEIELCCYFDLLHADWELSNNVENALKILKP